ncbi:MAG: hypothetical protein FE834_07755 [Gammaproteobacteria bacterium]|nr:hypothetical protein [Gammaproteobacteria bacterium]
MWINANTRKLSQNDTVILANNRQVLAFQKTWGLQKGNSALPKALSWQQFLQTSWQSLDPNSSQRLLSNNESRTLIEHSMLQLGQSEVDSRLLDEVIKNNNYCKNHLIEYTQLSQTNIANCTLFVDWMDAYQQTKNNNNLLDINDLSTIVINHPTQITAPYIYGFKTLTPVQSLLLNEIGYQILEGEPNTPQSDNQIFQTTEDEINAAAQWAKELHTQNPNKHIAIVCPTLNREHYQIKSIFDQVFANTLIETGEKSYNISLGLPLNDYPLIRHILNILTLCQQLKSNYISTDTFNAVITSPYISNAQEEQSARALLVNKVLKLEKTHCRLSHLKTLLDTTPHLKNNIQSTLTQSSKTKHSHDQWLSLFDNCLQNWGFATDRPLSSTEYQLFNKYQSARLGLNQLPQISQSITMSNAITDLKKWLSQVIFQAQSAKTPIQILGSLEAEGLVFDNAWVIGMTDAFLPVTLNTPRFIPSDIAQQHQIPHSNFTLISKDAQDTLNNLTHLAPSVTFSYAKTHFQTEQQPTPLFEFTTHHSPPTHKYHPIAMSNLTDTQSNPITNPQVKNGVNLLKDQMACPFKGFTHRLKTRSFNPPHIGLSRMEQGNIIHQALQYFYQTIPTQQALLALNDTELDKLIQQTLSSALKPHNKSAFKNIEQIRITRILHQFFTLEKTRPPFTVLSTEKEMHAVIKGLQFTTRLDRLDQMTNGDKIIFDYKTGNPTPTHWCGDAIKEPQLPIYAINNDTQGIAFIQLNADKIHIKGISKDPESLPKQRPTKACAKWNDQLPLWQTTLESTSQDFQSGKAEVTPTKDACDYCDFDPLCRIKK